VKFAAGTRDSLTDRPYFFLSECRRYTVTVPVGDYDRYTAWLASVDIPAQKRTTPAQMLGYFPTSKAAKAACETHANTH